ncbi:response regulator [Vibrio maritimus]|uniref:Response regulator n=1 Tax=Vibrio maritimus TaxID=990268 RepID=A0A090T0F8_9VIBR|nr:response regulator [Vibrio maritimus]
MDYNYLYMTSQSKEEFSIRLKEMFSYTRFFHSQLGRLSVAAFNKGVLSTYHSEFEESLISNVIEFKPIRLLLSSSLSELINNKKIRFVDDLNDMPKTQHIRMLTDAGFMSSLSFPIVDNDKVVGVVFFNAKQKSYFSSEKIKSDFIFLASLVSSMFVQVIYERKSYQQLLDVALKIGHHRDPETSQHLKRMGMYSELLARLLAEDIPEITTEFIHRIKFYAPFHDIGKYRIPDAVLFSNAVFSDKERSIMNMHPIYGEEIIDNVIAISKIKNGQSEDIMFLKNIIRSHHEAFDGSGYPDGLVGQAIPLESRIVTVADVFDALLSKRAYKDSWSLTEVKKFFIRNSKKLFDPVCVEKLLCNIDKFVEIRNDFDDSREMLTSNRSF